MKKMMLVALMVGGLFIVGCDEKKKDAAGGGETKAAASAEKGGGGGGGIGVPECDDYLKKMEACLGKMPAEAKAASEAAFKQSRDAWKQTAATPAGKDGLKVACKAANDALANNPACK
jgi:hypothetical protein